MNIAMLNPGVERQVGTSLEDIRDDHKERYLWASERLLGTDTVLDAGCGVGYGSTLLAQHAGNVHAVDISQDAIAYAQKYWSKPNISHAVEDLCFLAAVSTRPYDAVVAFEVVEHLIEPRLFLLRAFDVLKEGGQIFVSVPNEKVVPHTVNLNPFHLRHYTINEVRGLLLECGFEVTAVASQNTKEITEGDSGRFLILQAKRQAKPPAALIHAELFQPALSQAANFVVARAMSIHKATKDIRTLKARLEEANKAASSSEQRAETPLRLLQFVESFQAQTHASNDALVADLMRRAKDLESIERDLRERVLQAELQRTKAEEALRFTQQKCQDQTETLERVSVELVQARTAAEHQRDEAQQLRGELTQTAQESQALGIELEQVRRGIEADLATWKSQLGTVQKERDALADECTRLQTEWNQLSLQRDELKSGMQRLRNESEEAAQAQLLHAERETQLQRQFDMAVAAKVALDAEFEILRMAAADMGQEVKSAEVARSEQAAAVAQSEQAAAVARSEQAATVARSEQAAAVARSEHAAAVARLEQDRKDIAAQLDAAKKLASQTKAARNVMAVRLLAVGKDNQLVTAANEELVQKLQAAETEAVRLQRSIKTLQAELQGQAATAVKGPPSLGNIYKKLRVHRYYVPFLYKAVRNSVRNQTRRLRAKA